MEQVGARTLDALNERIVKKDKLIEEKEDVIKLYKRKNDMLKGIIGFLVALAVALAAYVVATHNQHPTTDNLDTPTPFDNTARGELLATACSEYQPIFPLAIDTTTPQPNARLEVLHTAVKKVHGWVTFRASQPLTAAHHRWAVRIHEVGSYIDIQLGLLPKLSADKVAKMGSTFIDDVGGWCIYQYGSESYVLGDWQCEKFPLAKGDLVLFDYSFSNKSLTIRCGGRQVVGHIPKAGEELFPAFALLCVGARVSFEKYE